MSGKGKGKAVKGKGAAAPQKYASAAASEVADVVAGASCTGTLDMTSFRDFLINNVSLSFHGQVLIDNAKIQLSAGHRYGLIGQNGSGKSTFLKCLAAREYPIPQSIDVFLVRSEMAATDDTALDTVLKVDEEREKLEKEASRLSDLLCEGDAAADDASEQLDMIYERLDELDSATARPRAAKILTGLGFSAEMQGWKMREFSGGWRMRVSLARALFLKPTLLLLDGPTAHLDAEACVWLEMYLQTFNPKGIILFISHSQDFLDGVCTDIIHLHNKQLTYYSGNYAQHVELRAQKDDIQNRTFKQQQEKISRLKDYIARFGHGTAKLARQARSREKLLGHIVHEGLAEEAVSDSLPTFRFPSCGELAPPVLTFTDVAFGYPGRRTLYSHLDLAIDLDSRIAILGPNGTGKSTLVKLMTGELQAVDGSVRQHSHLKISRYFQHSVDQLEGELSPMQHMMKLWPGTPDTQFRSFLGRFGLSGGTQAAKIGTLSDGQKARVVFATMAYRAPHMLILDEPTNSLDMESIDALADAINEFEGGVVLVSHDMRLLEQVADEIWIVDGGKVEQFKGDIRAYKDGLKKRIEKQFA